MKPEQIKRLYTEFGAEIALSSVCASSFKRTSPWKHRCILRYLKETYSEIISGYEQEQTKKNDAASETNATVSEMQGMVSKTKAAASEPPGTVSGTNSTASDTPAPIWTMWWQGTDDLPEVVSMCYASVNRHRGNHPFKIITCDNYQEYVSLPDHIMDKVRSGTISITHLSDIIRFALLSQHGGLWLDSTIFVADRIPEEIFTAEFFTVRQPLTHRSKYVAQDRWTIFLLAAQKGNLLCRFVFDFILEYYRTQEYLINYFLTDYTIKLAYDEIPQCRKLLDAVPVMENDLYRLENKMNVKWDPAEFEEIKANALFSKLSWRKEGRERTFSGEETIYGHLVKLTGSSL